MDHEAPAIAEIRLADAPAGGGLVDRWIALPARLVGGNGLLGAVFVAALVLLVPSGILWLTGSLRIPDLEPRVWLPAAIAGLVLALIVVHDRIALAALTDFEPALGPGPDIALLRRGLTSIPDRLALPAVVLIEVIATIGYLSDPPTLAQLQARSVGEAAMIVLVNWISIGAVALLLIHAWIQLRAVVRIHRMAARVDLFDVSPVHAFARLTAATGVGFLLVGILILGDPTARRDSLFYASEAIGVMVVAAITFAVPLWGMHERLVAEQQRLLREVNVRLQQTMERIGAMARAAELDGIDRFATAQAALIGQRELIARLSTWPWSTGTIRGFATTLLIPVAIWLITRLLDRVV
jgi:hypothetical protein